MRVGIFGGSFDPIHLAHLWMAESAREQLQLDQVLLIPTATSPLKPHGPVGSDEQRLAMLGLAIGGDAVLVVDPREIRRGGNSFTIDTVRQLKDERPQDEFFLLMGRDAFASLRQWHRPADLLSEVLPCVFRRGGEPPIDWSVLEGLASPERTNEIRAAELEVPMIELSSGEIRHRVATGKRIRYRVPHAVEAFIAAEGLYLNAF